MVEAVIYVIFCVLTGLLGIDGEWASSGRS